MCAVDARPSQARFGEIHWCEGLPFALVGSAPALEPQPYQPRPAARRPVQCAREGVHTQGQALKGSCSLRFCTVFMQPAAVGLVSRKTPRSRLRHTRGVCVWAARLQFILASAGMALLAPRRVLGEITTYGNGIPGEVWSTTFPNFFYSAKFDC